MLTGQAWLAAVLTLAALPAAAQTTDERPALGSTFTGANLADLPTGGSLYSVFDTMAAEVISDRIDTGGLYTGEAARIGSHGSSWTQTLFRVGDVDVTRPDGSGTPLLVPNVYAWDRVETATGLMPIEMNAPGMAVSMFPRQPSTTWTRSFEIFGTGPALLARQEVTNPPAIARQHTWTDGHVVLSGPLIPNRLGIVLAGGWTSSTRYERNDPTLLTSDDGSVMAHLVFTPTPRDEMHTIGWIEMASSPDANRVAFAQPLASESTHATLVQSSWEHRLSSGGSWAVSGSFAHQSQSSDLQPASTLVVERLLDGPVPELAAPSSSSNDTWSVGTRMKSAPFTLFDRPHSVRVGFVLSGASTTAQSTFNGRIGETIDGVPARIWQFVSPAAESEWGQTTVAAYAADTFPIVPRLTLDAGIRFETVRAAATGSTSQIGWQNWYPRANLRWELTRFANISAIAGFGRFGERLPLDDLAVGDPNAPYANVYRWNAAGSDPQLQQVGPLVARVGPGTGGNPTFSSIDPQLGRPYMDEFITGFESRPRAGTVVRLAAIARRERQLLGLVDVGVPTSAYSVSYIRDPGTDAVGNQLLPVYNQPIATFGQDRYLLTNPPDVQATFVGVEFTMQATFDRFFMTTGATAGRSSAVSANVGFGPFENDDGILGEVFIDPNARTFAQGRVFTERGYTIKTSGVWKLPWGIRLGYAARYQDGQHFARIVVVGDLNQGTEEIRASPNGITRFTFTGTLDGRLQKAFTSGRHQFTLLFDAYNILNWAQEVEEFSVTGPQSRLTSAVQPPRTVHLGLRFGF
jgi:hypothetical protein